MRYAMLILACMAGLAASAENPALPAPWSFGMSPAQVRDVAEGMPYKTFTNGDLETYNAVFEGRRENFQFFFRDGKLRRIGIYLYEGGSSAEAGAKWQRVHAWMVRNFGQVGSAGNVEYNSGNRVAFNKEAIRVAESDGKTQLIPGTQPPQAHIFASFAGQTLRGIRQYLVILYFDEMAKQPAVEPNAAAPAHN